MSDDQQGGIVVPFRPRDQVPRRRITSFRSSVPEQPWMASAPLRIDGEVGLGKLLLGLRAVGLAFKHDQRTGGYVILPGPRVPP